MESVSKIPKKTHILSKSEEAEKLEKEIRENIRESRNRNQRLRRKYGLRHHRK